MTNDSPILAVKFHNIQTSAFFMINNEV